MKLAIVPILVLTLFSSAAQAVVVTFSGTMDGFNAGPFSGGTDFSGSFVMDESVVPTSIGNKRFIGALNDLVIDIGGTLFTGGNGEILQNSSASGATDFFSLSVTDVTGSIGSDIFTRFQVDWRGPNLFDDNAVLASDLTAADFNYRRVVFQFNGTYLDAVIDNASQINFGPSSVPVPPAILLFFTGLFVLVATRVKG